ncbi:hypothetical protein [Neorhizobium sp. DT-125]|uniref:hypothetical protein n=1 Tax=Neorhizobium sp. DT-125 TaxID=3396163 RepID=UPI003F1ABCF5
MKIDSGLNGYHYPNRALDMARKIEDAPQLETPTFQRSPNALTGSSTLLSSSLANALWVVESGDAASESTAGQMPSVPQDWVEGIYQEFA